jgi:hypothetical protein
MGFHFSTVYVRDVDASQVREALIELMGESERVRISERGLEPTPDASTAHKRIRSFALMPEQDGWVALMEDSQSLDDGGLAEGLSELLQAETLLFTYSDEQGEWSFIKYWEGQPLEAGGSEDDDFDATALDFIESQALPHFGVYYEEIAAAAGLEAPSLAGSLGFVGEIVAKIPIGAEVLTFLRPGKPLPT